MANEPQITGDEIEDILDEIDENEKKQNTVYITNNNEYGVDWKNILRQIRGKNINFIKNLITSKEIHVNSKNPNDGKTLLIYAVISGDLDLVKAVCNFGADVHIKDNDNVDALDYAIKYGRYKITELVYYRQLSGKLGNDLKHISMQIHQKNKEAQYIYESSHVYHGIIDFMTKAIKNRAVFDQVMLYYAWYFVLKESDKDGSSPFDHELWKTMMKVYEEILCDTDDKKGWQFLKQYFVNSLIWYLPHPHLHQDKAEQKVDEDDEIENILQSTLFYELLVRVRTESKKQSDLLLKDKIDQITKEKPNEWQQLTSYDVNTEHSSTARQDVCGCLKPRFTADDLSEEKYPPSNHFNAKKHYDTNIYLNELIFKANILDSIFQNDMKRITKEINKETGDRVMYRAGPVKTLSRSQTKAENDYIKELYPTSAKILDINRCALQFKTIQQMMEFMKIFSNRIEDGKAGCIKQIIRCKNGWSIYNAQYPHYHYTDIKFSVKITQNDRKIIAEIQFLLDLMSSFKQKSHKLYSVERKFELVYNYGLLMKEMNTFKDNNDTNIILEQLATNDDLKYFKDLWETMTPTSKSLTNIIINLLSSKTGKIDRYLRTHFCDLYRASILFYIGFLSESWNSLLSMIESNQMDRDEFIQNLLHLFDETQKVKGFDDGMKILRSFGILLDHEIYSYLEPNESNQFVLKSPVYDTSETMNLHQNTEFKVTFNQITSSASLYTFGSAEYGMLGLGADSVESEFVRVSTPTICNSFNLNLKEIASNYYHHVAIDTYGNTYWWGQNQCGLMSFFDDTVDTKNENIPKLLPSFSSSKAVCVAVGGSHSLILTDDGRVYSFGTGAYGVLGHGDHKHVVLPKMIQALKDDYVTHISCGENFSCVIARGGNVYTFGENNHSQCGLGDNTSHEVYVPSKVDTNGLIPLYSDCGDKHTLLLTTTGEVLAWGRNNAGQLGVGDTLTRTTPQVIGGLSGKNIIDLSCGGWCSLCVTDVGECFSWGLGSTGHGDNEEQLLPKLILYFDRKHIKIVSCKCGPYHSGVITSNNEVYLCGNGGDGQMGLGEDDLEDKQYPTKVGYFEGKSIVGLSLGNGCSAVLTRNREDEKEEVVYLKANHQIQMEHKTTIDLKSRVLKLYIKNEGLYNHKDWMLLTQTGKYFIDKK